MKERIYLNFTSGKGSWNKVKDLLRDVGKENLLPKNSSIINFYGFYLWSNDKSLPLLIGRLKELEKHEGWKWGKRIERIYTLKELESCKLLTFRINQTKKGHGGPKWGTKYDLTKRCIKCGTGIIQKSSLILKSTEIPKNQEIFETLNNEIILSKRISRFLDTFKGAKLTQISILNQKNKSEFYQFTTKAELPAMLKISKGIVKDKSCDLCKRYGYFHSTDEPFEPHYTLDDALLKSSDVFSTYEYFGYNVIKEKFSDSIFAKPLTIIKPSVMKVFNKLKIRNVKFEPVVVNDYPDIESWEKRQS